MKKIFTIIAALPVIAATLGAQHAHFTRSGVIEFERRTNVYAMMTKEINKDNEAFMAPALEAYKKTNPQFRILKSTLSFADSKTLFTPEAPDQPANGVLSNSPLMNQSNIIFTDLATKSCIAQRSVYDETYLVKDSTRKIRWKITDETREIAGYTCRRANAIMLDSIYVVAFYATDIPVPGGPESFSGLPGMILGVALPHENVTWFATKVTNTTIAPNAIIPPKKGKPLNNKGFYETLTNASKDWGQIGKDFIKGFMF